MLRNPAKTRPVPKRPEEPKATEGAVVSVPESSTSRRGRIDGQIFPSSNKVFKWAQGLDGPDQIVRADLLKAVFPA